MTCVICIIIAAALLVCFVLIGCVIWITNRIFNGDDKVPVIDASSGLSREQINLLDDLWCMMNNLIEYKNYIIDQYKHYFNNQQDKKDMNINYVINFLKERSDEVDTEIYKHHERLNNMIKRGEIDAYKEDIKCTDSDLKRKIELCFETVESICPNSRPIRLMR